MADHFAAALSLQTLAPLMMLFFQGDFRFNDLQLFLKLFNARCAIGLFLGADRFDAAQQPVLQDRQVFQGHI
jgi:hypothetical protein